MARKLVRADEWRASCTASVTTSSPRFPRTRANFDEISHHDARPLTLRMYPKLVSYIGKSFRHGRELGRRLLVSAMGNVKRGHGFPRGRVGHARGGDRMGRTSYFGGLIIQFPFFNPHSLFFFPRFRIPFAGGVAFS